MVVVKVWMLPLIEPQFKRVVESFKQDIINAVLEIKKLELTGTNQVSVLFPQSLLQSHQLDEIVVEISIPYYALEQTKEVATILSKKIGDVVKLLYKNARVKCFVQTLNSVGEF